ncbi:hypothetical protein AGOR_G00032720 [Albula goreensis]|uniref:Immunoglobulin V-set domain-containing protein n=1 Tax=Albula goreensis TaxID=1534307 RepID=A0A8T3DW14_9TELE|nr:hypothetical protein AGOR_G00032720 [Albula goreensis]
MHTDSVEGRGIQISLFLSLSLSLCLTDVMFILLVPTLLISATSSVCRAEDPVCVLEGSSKWLDVPEYQDLQFNTMFWNFNNDESVLEYSHKFKDLTVYKAFKDKVEFSQTNFSLLLKSMQAGDSGLYTAKIIDANGKIKHVAKHRLSVKEAVPKPQVRVELLSSERGYCNVSVNCSAKDTWATYTCDLTHCTQVQSTPSPSAINITVTATNGSILCESSNCASTSSQSASIEDHCSVSPMAPPPGLSACQLKAVLFSLGLVAMVSAVIAVNVRGGSCRMK